MILSRCITLATCAAVLFAVPAWAHVQVFVPTITTATPSDSATVSLDIRFVEHAIDNGPALPMAQPLSVGVIVNGEKHPLDDRLQPHSDNGVPWFSVSHTMTAPSAHVFYMQPAPYWDATEAVMITHYSEVIVNSCAAGLPTESAMGWENWEGWDQLVCFPVEIEPLVQPTALWTGSVFRGVVLFDGKPARDARLEVEYYDRGDAVKLPSAAFKTQILKTDASGTFSFVPVRAGWWVFSAIRESKEPVRSPDGAMVPEEQGGVLWIEAVDME